MTRPDSVLARYTSGDYLASNPTWDAEDSPWKARKLVELLSIHRVQPASIVDIGCGAGHTLAELGKVFPVAKLEGYDVAPDAARFWDEGRKHGITLTVGDFFSLSARNYELAIAFDVLEHLADPFAFLARLRGRAAHYAFHFPLDLSSLSVLRERPLLESRRRVGHIHYYTRGLAVALLEEHGYEIVEAAYTRAWLDTVGRSLRTRLAALPRRIGYALARDLSVRLLGGETLMVLARDR